ncbi:uncharacterized protein [Palaemon carinicauda]|uniref:uncharacterized protein n=1 Tax=Palaemon carinicauda TaxID=392227 RepID=UPI0035B57597
MEYSYKNDAHLLDEEVACFQRSVYIPLIDEAQIRRNLENVRKVKKDLQGGIQEGEAAAEQMVKQLGTYMVNPQQSMLPSNISEEIVATLKDHETTVKLLKKALEGCLPREKFYIGLLSIAVKRREEEEARHNNTQVDFMLGVITETPSSTGVDISMGEVGPTNETCSGDVVLERGETLSDSQVLVTLCEMEAEEENRKRKAREMEAEEESRKKKKSRGIGKTPKDNLRVSLSRPFKKRGESNNIPQMKYGENSFPDPDEVDFQIL